MQIPDNAPFSPEQRAAFNNLLATMTPEQQVWVSGFFCGVTSSSLPAVGGAVAAAPAATELTILFGTESGNCEELADKTKKIASKSGFKPKVVNMSETDTKKLSKSKNILVIVSTWGDGDPPDAATAFYTEFMSDAAAKFPDTNYTICALGDTAYEQFCEIGKKMDAQFEKLGATRVYDRIDCDLDYEEPWEKWLDGALKAFPVNAPAAPVNTGLATVAPGEAIYSKKNPFPAEVTEKILLSGTGSAKETLHLELNLTGSGLQYEAGDALAIVPENRDKDVQAVLKASGLSANTQINGKTLADALKTDYDITSLTSRIAGKYNAYAENGKLAALLDSDPKKKKEFNQWAWGRQFVDLLEEYPCKGMTVEQLTGILRKMAPRLYSIASSPKAHEGEVHLTVAAVRYDTHGKDRVGVASTYVADIVSADDGDKVPVYVHSNKNFRLPADPATSIIMIGPGTGIAPFRAFVEERAETKAPGKNWLFFGDQHYSYDFLYQLEWQEFLKEGALDKLDVAFSRDQPEKVYVQDKLRESAKEIYEWIDGGATIYVCGDKDRMAVDVNSALIDIISEQGGKSPEDAEAFLAEMKKAKRYQRDVY